MLASQTSGSYSRMPRTMPVIHTNSLPFSSASLASEASGENFSLSSSLSGSRRYHGGRPNTFSGSHPDGDFLLPASSGVNYAPVSTADSLYAVPLMTVMNGFDTDMSSDFLSEDIFSDNNMASHYFEPAQYLGQAQPQVAFNSSGFMSSEMSFNTGTYSGLTPIEYLQQGPPSPEDEESIEYKLASLSGQNTLCPDEEFTIDQADTFYNATQQRSDLSSVLRVNATNQYLDSLDSRSFRPPRPLRSASERNMYGSDQQTSPTSSTEARSPSKEDTTPREKARTHPLYNSKPDKNGKFHCPMMKQGQCNHPPTPQRCVYK